MDLIPISAPTRAAPATDAPANESAESATVLSSDFEVFLQMLTAQAEYQDPLEPIDSTEYAAQLAQFSMVEQQVATNELLEKLISGFSTGEVSNLAGWIGMDALTYSPVNFNGSPVTLTADPPAATDEMYLIVYDSRQQEVQRQLLPPTDDQISWAGVSDTGSPFEYGEYTFKFEYRAENQVLSTEPAQTYTRVTEARVQDGDTFLLLDSGYAVRTNDVLGVREPA